MKQKVIFYLTMGLAVIGVIGLVVRIPGVGPVAKGWING